MRRLALAVLAAHALLLCAPALAQTAPPAPAAAPAQTAPAAAPTPAPLPAPRDGIRGILHREPYSFCHDGRRFVRPTEMEYCQFVGPQSACPEFAQACERMKHRPSCSAPRHIGSAGSAAVTCFLCRGPRKGRFMGPAWHQTSRSTTTGA